jgi:hypothetical protein
MSVASILFVVFATGFLTSPVRTGFEASRLETAKAPCCFHNPGYAGTCKVEPADDETCAGILAYLNNPVAQGKSYCGGTTVRQGWAEVACEESSKESASATTCR